MCPKRKIPVRKIDLQDLKVRQACYIRPAFLELHEVGDAMGRLGSGIGFHDIALWLKMALNR